MSLTPINRWPGRFGGRKGSNSSKLYIETNKPWVPYIEL